MYKFKLFWTVNGNKKKNKKESDQKRKIMTETLKIE